MSKTGTCVRLAIICEPLRGNLYGKLRQSDFLPVGEEREDEILERGYHSASSADSEGCGLDRLLGTLRRLVSTVCQAMARPRSQGAGEAVGRTHCSSPESKAVGFAGPKPRVDEKAQAAIAPSKLQTITLHSIVRPCTDFKELTQREFR